MAKIDNNLIYNIVKAVENSNEFEVENTEILKAIGLDENKIEDIKKYKAHMKIVDDNFFLNLIRPRSSDFGFLPTMGDDEMNNIGYVSWAAYSLTTVGDQFLKIIEDNNSGDINNEETDKNIGMVINIANGTFIDSKIGNN